MTKAMSIPRTELQRDADRLDCDLYRLICRVEVLWQDYPRARDKLHDSLQGLRGARNGLRSLMHELDRKETT